MTATYDDMCKFQDAIYLLSDSNLLDRLRASALEYANWVVKNDPKRLHPKTDAASDFAANSHKFDYRFEDDSSGMLWEDWRAERYFHFPLEWISNQDRFKEAFLDEVAVKMEAKAAADAEKQKETQANKYKRYLALKEEFEGRDEA